MLCGERARHVCPLCPSLTSPYARTRVPKSREDGGASAPSPALPLARVSRIMKLDPDVTRFSKEALLLTAVATEAFLEGLTDHAAAAAKVRTDPAVRPVTLTWTDDRLGLDDLQSGAMAGSFV